MANKYAMTLEVEEQEYVLLEPGEYQFKVDDIEFGEHNGSAKIPPCGKVVVSLSVDTEQGKAFMKNNFYVCQEGAGLIAAFLKSIGVLKDGQKTFTPDWESYVGKTGIVKTSQREYNGNKYNNVDRFVAPKKTAAPASKKRKWDDAGW
jgi:hypothetical protein